MSKFETQFFNNNIEKLKQKLNGIKKSDLLELVLNAVENPVIPVLMETYGTIINKVECTGCAATNLILKELELDKDDFLLLANNDINECYFKDEDILEVTLSNMLPKNLESNQDFISLFENIIDDIRSLLNLMDTNASIKRLQKNFKVVLPELTEEDQENLPALEGNYEIFKHNIPQWKSYIQKLKNKKQ